MLVDFITYVQKIYSKSLAQNRVPETSLSIVHINTCVNSFSYNIYITTTEKNCTVLFNFMLVNSFLKR